jgi:hypothetical protein
VHGTGRLFLYGDIRMPPVARAVFAAAERSLMTRNFVARSTEAQAGRTPAPMRANGN